MSTIWIKHPVLDAVSEVPASALPQWRQAGWDLLPDDELAELKRTDAEASAAAEKWLRGFSGNNTAEDGSASPAPDTPSSEDADGRLTEEGNG